MEDLANQFTEYLSVCDDGSDRPLRVYLKEFYYATFGCNNETQ